MLNINTFPVEISNMWLGEMWKVTFTMWHVTSTMGQVTFTKWWVTFTMWQVTFMIWLVDTITWHVVAEQLDSIPTFAFPESSYKNLLEDVAKCKMAFEKEMTNMCEVIIMTSVRSLPDTPNHITQYCTLLPLTDVSNSGWETHRPHEGPSMEMHECGFAYLRWTRPGTYFMMFYKSIFQANVYFGSWKPNSYRSQKKPPKNQKKTKTTT